jgi:glyoxylase-like metal-dependent hydrolase (beta-lactamase superfamily II)
LIDDGNTAILYDTGFGFTGHQIARNIRARLGDRPLDYIFLTHSHYDHALGCASILMHYPKAKVVAAAYAKQIFEKPSALAAMGRLDQKAAQHYGIRDYQAPELPSPVDLAVSDGDRLTCGDLTFTVVALPGHTKCSIGFYLERERLLLGSETLGVYFGQETYLPSFLVGYQMTLASFQKAKALDVEQILVPHYGVIQGEEADAYLRRSEEITRHTAQRIRELSRSGCSEEAIFEDCTRRFYHPHVVPTYPPEAFKLNTGIMIRLVLTEDPSPWINCI